MANRVSVNINANDLTRSGIRSVRNSINRLQRTLPNNHVITVSVNRGASRAEIRRVNRMIRSLPNSTTVRVNMVGPGRGQTRGVTNSIRRSLTSPLRLMQGLISGTLQDGVGQGLIQGVQRAGPIAGAIFVAAILAALALLGAAIAGALVLAFGLGIAGIGAAILLQSKAMKKRWTDTLDELKPLFANAAKPMIPVLETARGIMDRLARQLAPALEDAFARMGPALEGFLGRTESGLKRMGSAMWEPLQNGFNTFLIAFGPQWEGWLEGLGEAFGDLGNTVREHSSEIALALRVVLEMFTLIIKTINFLAQVWAAVVHGFFVGVGSLIKAFAVLADAVFDTFALILTAADVGLSWIPDWGNEIGNARDAFDRFRDETVNNLHATGDAIKGISTSIKETNAQNKIRADISQLEGKVRDAKRRLRETNDVKVKAKIGAEISDLQRKIAVARGQLASINGRTATTYITTIKRTLLETMDRRHGLRTGGIKGAANGGVRSNLTMVGEQGPELVDLPAGSRVRSNPDTRRMMGGAGAGNVGGEQTVINFILDGRVVASATLDSLQKVIAAKGGNVQRVLGRGSR